MKLTWWKTGPSCVHSQVEPYSSKEERESPDRVIVFPLREEDRRCCPDTDDQVHVTLGSNVSNVIHKSLISRLTLGNLIQS